MTRANIASTRPQTRRRARLSLCCRLIWIRIRSISERMKQRFTRAPCHVEQLGMAAMIDTEGHTRYVMPAERFNACVASTGLAGSQLPTSKFQDDRALAAL